jgi:hypothetical protein
MNPRWLRIVASIVGAGLLAGCGNEYESDAPTYYQDVAPILAQNCLSCHSPGGIAPLPLGSYAEAQVAATRIAAETAARRMPPFHVDNSGDCGTFRDARWLDDDAIATLGSWSAAGAPEGTEAPAPSVPLLPTLANVSVTVDAGSAYTPRTGADDDYRCFLVDLAIDRDHFLTGYEVKPDAVSQVHHVVLYSVDSAAEQAIAEGLDAAEDGPGYTCFGGSGTGAGRSLAVWTPGAGATSYPEGTGLRVVGGRPLIMQIHYNRGTLPDRSAVDLTLVESVEKEAFFTGTFDISLALTPGMEHIEQTAALPLPALPGPMQIHGAYPHMHRYGRSLRVEYDADGASTCLVNVPDYDFAWQQFFFYEEPVTIEPPGGGYFRIACGYDTRGADAPITWGEGTDDEMCIAALYATF